MSVAPRRRSYKNDPTRKSAVAADDRMRLWMPRFIGSGIGLMWGAVLGGAYFGHAVLGGLLGMVLMGGFTVLMVRIVLGVGSESIAKTLLPTGTSTAYKRQYSDAEARAARGEHEAAVVAYARYVMEDPADPEPYFRIARIYRSEIQDFEQAVHWYRRARQEATMDPGRDLQATQELVEIYIHKLKQPRKAIPELARLVERYPHTPPARAATEELVRLRSLLASEGEDGESLTGRYYKGD